MLSYFYFLVLGDYNSKLAVALALDSVITTYNTLIAYDPRYLDDRRDM